MSVRAVAHAVGTTTRAVYTVFGSKAELIEGLAARGYLLLADYVASLPATDDPAADLVAVGVSGFRRFAVERPHLFRLTFERVPAGMASTRTAGPAAAASYDALVRWIRRAQAAEALEQRPEVEIAFIFHALCQGLASGELAREPPPVGAGFWRPARDVDADQVWRTALRALVAGLGPRSTTAEVQPSSLSRPAGSRR